MGMLDIALYKLNIMKEIIRSPEIVEAIDCPLDKYDPEAPDTLIYERIFPYLRIPETQSEAATYILMAVDNVNPISSNKYFCDMRITLWVLSHQECMKMKNKNSTRIDYISKKLEELLVGQTRFGYGVLELISDREIILNENYHYREITFRTTDLARPVCR